MRKYQYNLKLSTYLFANKIARLRCTWCAQATLVLALLTSFSFEGEAQQRVDDQYNPNSIFPIPKYEHLYNVKVWREIDLREKQNKGFFARGNEISKFIVDMVKSGELMNVYRSDSLIRKIPKDEFLLSLVSQQGQAFPAWNPSQDWYAGDRVSLNGRNYEAIVDNIGSSPEESLDEDWQETSAGKAVEFLPFEMYKLTLQEDFIFDKRSSRLYYDMQSIQLLAFDLNTGTYKSLGWFKYKDLEKLFRENPKKAFWFNTDNYAENKNYADAFLLRLFHGTIAKVQNPDNESIYDIYVGNGRPYIESVWAREWEEMRLMEKEHNLWEY